MADEETPANEGIRLDPIGVAYERLRARYPHLPPLEAMQGISVLHAGPVGGRVSTPGGFVLELLPDGSTRCACSACVAGRGSDEQPPDVEAQASEIRRLQDALERSNERERTLRWQVNDLEPLRGTAGRLAKEVVAAKAERDARHREAGELRRQRDGAVAALDDARRLENTLREELRLTKAQLEAISRGDVGEHPDATPVILALSSRVNRVHRVVGKAIARTTSWATLDPRLRDALDQIRDAVDPDLPPPSAETPTVEFAGITAPDLTAAALPNLEAAAAEDNGQADADLDDARREVHRLGALVTLLSDERNAYLETLGEARRLVFEAVYGSPSSGRAKKGETLRKLDALIPSEQTLRQEAERRRSSVAVGGYVAPGETLLASEDGLYAGPRFMEAVTAGGQRFYTWYAERAGFDLRLPDDVQRGIDDGTLTVREVIDFDRLRVEREALADLGAMQTPDGRNVSATLAMRTLRSCILDRDAERGELLARLEGQANRPEPPSLADADREAYVQRLDEQAVEIDSARRTADEALERNQAIRQLLPERVAAMPLVDAVAEALRGAPDPDFDGALRGSRARVKELEACIDELRARNDDYGPSPTGGWSMAQDENRGLVAQLGEERARIAGVQAALAVMDAALPSGPAYAGHLPALPMDDPRFVALRAITSAVNPAMLPPEATS